MSKDFQRVSLPARRHFLGISAAVAGSLPFIVLASPARADDDHEDHKGPKGPRGNTGNCFLQGTRVLTPHGEVPIEELTIGSLVVTLNGPLPVKWIGRRTFKKVMASSWHPGVAPIRVARFALDDQYPLRDLYLSPEHSLFVDGALIPVKYLVNGRSIAPAAMDDRAALEYFHIELETHEVVFAEGAAAETLQVTTDREAFANFIEHERLYGREEQPAMKAFAPVLGYRGGREELRGLLRLAVSPIVDVRDPIQKAYDRIAARAELANT
jgi:hypothetical protein